MTTSPDLHTTRLTIQRVLVPLDLTGEADRALHPAIAVAGRLRAPLTLFGWHWDYGEVAAMSRHMQQTLEDLGVDGRVEARCSPERSAAGPLLSAARAVRNTLICMATHARTGVGEALLGSVAEQVLHTVHDPVLLVGPHADPTPPDLRGPVVACLDGSRRSEQIVPVAEAWADALGVGLELVTSLDPDVGAGEGHREPPDVVEAGYVATVARRAGATWEVLHGDHPARAVAHHTQARAASMVVVGTHGRTGLARVVMGSVGMRIVHHSPRPTLVVRTEG